MQNILFCTSSETLCGSLIQLAGIEGISLYFSVHLQVFPPFLTRYAKTVGLEGSFQSDTLSKGGNSFDHQIKLRGNLYKEVENVEVTLTTNAEDKPKDFKFKVGLISLSSQSKFIEIK